MSEQRLGEIPTTGLTRPGPILGTLTVSPLARVRPIAIRVARVQIDTTIERQPIKDGVMANPSGPYVVAWYGSLGWLGEPGNVVLAGHVDYAGVGPAVFARLGELVPDDLIELTGSDVHAYRFYVEWSKLYDADNPPMKEIVGETSAESLTLVTCGGDFNYSSQHYLQRLVVRAKRGN